MTERPGGTGRLGQHTVARIGFGAMQLAERGGATPPPRETALAVLRQAVESGVDHIDTAQFYGDGLANELIAAALRPYPDDLVLVSKVGAKRDPAGGLIAAQRPAELRAGVEENLRTLGVERLDVVNLRRLDGGAGIRAEGEQLVDLDAQLAELAALRAEGKIGSIGLSNVDAGQLRAALPVGVVCVQNAYNLLERSDEDLLTLCGEHGVAWVPFFPLGSAFARMAKVTEHPEVLVAADGLGASPAQVGLAWLLGRAEHVLLIPGTADATHLAENIAAGALDLGAHAAKLDAVST